MTFIASVLAKEGVAIVTDSFVTSEEYSINWSSFRDYIDKKAGATSISIDEIKELFTPKPSYTRNYTEKLFKFDEHSAITTAGHAYLNEMPVKDIIDAISLLVRALPGYPAIPIITKIDNVVSYLTTVATEQINKVGYIGATSFIFSHYNTDTHEPQIFKIKIAATTKNQLDAAIAAGNIHVFVTYANETNYGYVTDGQDEMVDRLLFGSLYKYSWLPFRVANAIIKELKFKKVTREKIITFLNNNDVMEPYIKQEIGYINRRPLSLQEAVDFAALLVRIVINIQAYTEKIPTVGGVIKLAVIDKKGFHQINGHEIIKPNLIY